MSWEKDPCFLCEANGQDVKSNNDGSWEVHCKHCGEYKCSETAITLELQALQLKPRAKLNGWIRQQIRQKMNPFIDKQRLKEILQAEMPTSKQRQMFLLSEAIFDRSEQEPQIDLMKPKYLNSIYSSDKHDLHALLGHLETNGLVRSVTPSGAVVTVKGRIAAEEFITDRGNSERCFIAMWFNPKLSQVYEEGFKPGVTNAGYVPWRIDEVEHNNKIDDEIIAAIRSSAFLIADFTGHRGGVYFEAGFAMGLGMHVVWTCREDEVNDLHFDIRQYNCVTWNEPEELAKKLKNRIEATIGRGPA